MVRQGLGRCKPRETLTQKASEGRRTESWGGVQEEVRDVEAGLGVVNNSCKGFCYKENRETKQNRSVNQGGAFLSTFLFFPEFPIVFLFTLLHLPFMPP